MFRCRYGSCGHYTFNSHANLIRHEQNAHRLERTLPCNFCANLYSRELHRSLHERCCPQNPAIRYAPVPDRPVATQSNASGSGLRTGLRSLARTQYLGNLRPKVHSTAFGGANRTWRVKYGRNNGAQHVQLLVEGMQSMVPIIIKYRAIYQSLKVVASLHMVFHKAVDPSILTCPPYVSVQRPLNCTAPITLQRYSPPQSPISWNHVSILIHTREAAGP